MKALSKCSNCDTGIFPDDVMKTVAIIQSPQHVALVYKCSYCGNKSKVVAEQLDWAARKTALDEERAKRAARHAANDPKHFRVHEIELDAVESVDDLVALWASYPTPPIREAVMGACGCDDCSRRLYA